MPEVLKEEFQVPVGRDIFPCPVCQLPMFVSIGQIVACHKECKNEYKRLMKKAAEFEKAQSHVQNNQESSST